MNYDELDAVGMAAAVSSRKVSAKELLDEAIGRAERLNPALNAIVIPMFEQARAQLDSLSAGPFSGVPFLLKDIGTPYAGVPLTGASYLYRNSVPTEDGELTKRYKRAGLVIFGKTNTPEFGIHPVTTSRLYGPCENPWRRGLNPGGSSGGSAAAVAARIVPMAHATDGGGSIRNPASNCGVFGMKPSRAMTPAGPQRSETLHGNACEHVVSRSVRDSARALDVSAGPDFTAPYYGPYPSTPFEQAVERAPGKLRIALWTDPLVPADAPHPEVVRGARDAARLCESLGHDVQEVQPQFNRERFAHAFFLLFAVSVSGEMRNAERMLGRRPRFEEVELTTWLGALIGETVSGGEFSLALRDLQDTARDFARFFERYDVLLTPTLGQLPQPHNVVYSQGWEKRASELIVHTRAAALLRLPGIIDRVVGRAYRISPYTMIANAGGMPSMSVPLHMTPDGLPVGVMFTSRYGADGLLFQLAGQLEREKPWADLRPSVS